MKVNVLGVPDSAGAYCVGVERAPAALRDAGLIDALVAAGCDVRDNGDLTTRLWAPDRESPYAQNVAVEAEALRELTDAARGLISDHAKLIVIGGSCIVALGMCAALADVHEHARLIYVDRHLDLNTPESTTEGSLSWMGMAHALDVGGAVQDLADATGQAPLLRANDLVYLGVDMAQTTEGEREHAQSLDLRVVTQASLCEDPRRSAATARAHLGPGPFVVHLDVDVLDFIDAPIAENVNGRNSGPTIAQLEIALTEVLSDPDCRGLSIGQLVPAHAESDPTALPRLVAALARALSAAT